VNATSLGLDPSDPLPLERAGSRARALLDLAYSRDATPLVRAAREAGLAAEDGRRMLVEQAAASFERWIGVEAPRDAMFAAAGLGA
jgi:shikimate dehydrogenase